MNQVVLVATMTVVGAVLVGPLLNHAVVHWIGWRVVLPPCFGRVPAAEALGPARARCSRCCRSLAPAGLPALPATVVAGRCRGCGAGLARRYIALELVITWVNRILETARLENYLQFDIRLDLKHPEPAWLRMFPRPRSISSFQ